jgi:RNA-directed DNA polymerase
MTRRRTEPAVEDPPGQRNPSEQMEEVAELENLRRAYKRVRQNKGSPGPDGQTVEELGAYLSKNIDALREELMAGTYQPGPVRKVLIPKEGGGKRQLGIPNVLDRMVQQALLLVLTPIFDPDFSESSFGFRPGRSQHDALGAVRAYVRDGYQWVVNLDLRKFFDTVQHDVLMARVAKKVADKRILGLIGRFLRAGLMSEGVASPRSEGTPQGGPLSPMLSNVLLDDLDKELEARGHRFVRFADDFVIFKKSERAAWRTKASVGRFLMERLKLQVNEDKSGVVRPWRLTYLGYSFVRVGRDLDLTTSRAAKTRLRNKLRGLLTGQGRGKSIERTVGEVTVVLRGWWHYFRLGYSGGSFKRIDGWVRRRVRCLFWRQWGWSWQTRYRRLRARGVIHRHAATLAATRKGPWRASKTPAMSQAFPNRYLNGDLGLFSLYEAQKEYCKHR